MMDKLAVFMTRILMRTRRSKHFCLTASAPIVAYTREMNDAIQRMQINAMQFQ